MYVCMYVCIYIYTHTHTHTHAQRVIEETVTPLKNRHKPPPPPASNATPTLPTAPAQVHACIFECKCECKCMLSCNLSQRVNFTCRSSAGVFVVKTPSPSLSVSVCAVCIHTRSECAYTQAHAYNIRMFAMDLAPAPFRGEFPRNGTCSHACSHVCQRDTYWFVRMCVHVCNVGVCGCLARKWPKAV